MASSESTSSAQFWDDFWNTLYQFTHPFSSTFFDSLMDGSSTASDSSVPPVKQEQPPQHGQKKQFSDMASFEKFWRQLQHGHQGSAPTTAMEHIQFAWTDMKTAAFGFISSVEWEQTWIQIILALHLIIFITIILLRNNPNALGAMLFCTIVLAALSEPLNGIGHRHWQLFSDDNYFDSYGVFMGLVWALPHLINAMLAVVLLLRATIGLLIKVKRAQLQESRTRKQK
ncbi:transmembrane protein 18 [Entomortierella parvispora]|uniref:Transmembrane protein 18 n=1 Tax=Entomortierella parvispora TaxID=205924 RepID=A0A9P3HKE8_9FUNG|nr:transmembrane protein 18 [Entomortierella parvispora]